MRVLVSYEVPSDKGLMAGYSFATARSFTQKGIEAMLVSLTASVADEMRQAGYEKKGKLVVRSITRLDDE